MLSIAAAVIVTRVSSPLDLTGQMSSQFSSPGARTPVAVILALLGCLPGLPHFIILRAAGIAGYVADRLKTAQTAADRAPAVADGASTSDPGTDLQFRRHAVTAKFHICDTPK